MLFLYLSFLTLRSKRCWWNSERSSNWGKRSTIAFSWPVMMLPATVTLLISPVKIFSGTFGPMARALLASIDPAL
jgi:hypothetical protein